MDYPLIIKVPEGEKTLRTPSRPVNPEEFGSAWLENLLDGMFNSLMHAKEQTGYEGAGLAAPQIGENVQVLYALNVNSDEFFEFINPEIEFLGDATDLRNEACLSIPNFEGPVRRHKRIRITYKDKYGNEHIEKYSGINARILQHEYDHLQGVLFTDKLEKNENLSK